MGTELETVADSLGVIVGISTDATSAQGLTDLKLANGAAQALSSALTACAVVPGPTPVNGLASGSNLAALLINWQVTIDDQDDATSSPSENNLSILADYKTGIGDFIKWLGTTGVFVGFEPSFFLSRAGLVAGIVGTSAQDLILAGRVSSVVPSLLQSAIEDTSSKALQTLANIGSVLAPYLGTTGNALLDDLGTFLSYVTLAATDYGTASFQTDVTNVSTSMTAMKTDAVNIFNALVGSTNTPESVTQNVSTISFTNGSGQITGSASIPTNSNDVTYSVLYQSGSSPVNLVGSANVNADSSAALSVQDTSATGTASQNIDVSGAAIISQRLS